ncbi:hotdog fold thioesterase [Streptomyces sp. NBC_00442]|uniref:hotdog fold thioesterase n=1 Tax=Streptomyces sp. NBC_00442 TaxID=2903651 RepID=UPI003FA72479
MKQMALGPVAVRSGYETEQLVERMGVKLLLCQPGLVVGTLPVTGNRQPFGVLHGGANAVLAETLGSVAAYLHAGPGGNAVGLDLSCTHHRWVSSGTVTGECRPLFERRTIASYEIAILDEAGLRTCTARLTCVIRRGAVSGRPTPPSATPPTAPPSGRSAVPRDAPTPLHSPGVPRPHSSQSEN